jgi:hypothetical protein
VSTSSQLVAALADPSPRDIVLANGTYDNSKPFYNPYGHRIYAANLGGAVLRAGLSLGANDGPGGGSVQGIAFDVDDPAKTLANSVVNVWGAGARSQIQDVTVDGHGAIASGIAVQSREPAVVQRVSVRHVKGYGILALGGGSASNPIVLQDLDIGEVTEAVPGSSNAKAEACVWLASRATVQRALIRSCGFAGIWVGGGNTGSVLENIDVDGTPTGVFVQDTVSQLSARRLRAGTSVSDSVHAPGLAARQPTTTAPAGELVVVPSAHNTYLRVAAESGALGFVALSAYLILMFWSLLTKRWREHWALVIAMGVVLVAGLGIDTLHWRQLWIYLGMAAAVGVRNAAPIGATGGVAIAAGALRLGGRALQPLGTALANLRRRPERRRRTAYVVTPHVDPAPNKPARGMDAFDLRAELLSRDVGRTPRESSLADHVARVGNASAALEGAIQKRWRFLQLSGARAGTAVRDGLLPSFGRSFRARRAMPKIVVRVGHEVHVPSALVTESARAKIAAPTEPEPIVPKELVSDDLDRAKSRLGAKQLTLGYDHPDVAAELHFIGAIYHDAGRYAEAVGFYGAALAIRERALGPDHPEVASTLEDLAAARREDGEAEEADVLLARANRIRESRRQAAVAGPTL